MTMPEWKDEATSIYIANYAAPAIAKEHERAIQKWGHEQLSPPEWLMLLTEELGELSEAISESIYHRGPKDHIIKEAIQTATLAIKIAIMCEKTE